MDDWTLSFYQKNRPWITMGFSIILLISLFFYIGMIYELAGELIAWIPILLFGDSVQGSVTRQSTVESDGIFYQLEFEYPVLLKDGGFRDYSGKNLVNQSYWRNHEPGTTIHIAYLPWFPSLARIEEHPYELNMWMMTCGLYTAFFLQIVLIPIGFLNISKSRWGRCLLISLRVGDITMFIVTILVTILELLLDLLGMHLGSFSGGAIPLIVGVLAGLIVSLTIWHQPRSISHSTD
jgi:hypothetical protein